MKLHILGRKDLGNIYCTFLFCSFLFSNFPRKSVSFFNQELNTNKTQKFKSFQEVQMRIISKNFAHFESKICISKIEYRHAHHNSSIFGSFPG